MGNGFVADAPSARQTASAPASSSDFESADIKLSWADVDRPDERPHDLR